MNLTKTPYLVMFVILGAIGVTAVSAAVLVTVDELEILNGLTCPGCIDSADIADGTILAVDLGDSGCADGEVLKWNTGILIWECVVDADTIFDGTDFALSGQSCSAGQKATGFDASGTVVCGADIDTDTLAGLGCATDQIAKWDGANWVCVDIDELLPVAPVSCLELFNRGQTTSGLYFIDPNVSPVPVYCDMVTDGGGWTMVYRAPSNNENTLAPVYDVNSAALLTSATEALVAYRDSNNISTSPTARFDIPTNWRTAHPLSYQGEDEAVQVFIDGIGPTATTLRYGYFTFSSICDNPWLGNQWGRLCFTGTTAPFYSGFAISGGDWCTISDVPFNIQLCSTSRVFTIAVR